MYLLGCYPREQMVCTGLDNVFLLDLTLFSSTILPYWVLGSPPTYESPSVLYFFTEMTALRTAIVSLFFFSRHDTGQ